MKKKKPKRKAKFERVLPGETRSTGISVRPNFPPRLNVKGVRVVDS